MNSNMVTQIPLCGIWLTTMFTCIWFLSCMNSNMFTQTPLLVKWLSTVFTNIWFLSCMSSNMFTQILLCEKWLAYCSQSYGFSPVWVLIWLQSFPRWLNDLPQCSQAYGFSVVFKDSISELIHCEYRNGSVSIAYSSIFKLICSIETVSSFCILALCGYFHGLSSIG